MKLSNLNRMFLILSLTLLAYGYFCRIGSDFFWESKTIGWTVLLITIISIAIEKIRMKKVNSNNTILEKIIIGVITFVLLMQCIMYLVLLNSESYPIAKKYLFNDKTITHQIGNIESIVLTPVGGMAMSSSAEGSEGETEFNFIVKGKEGFLDVNLLLYKELKKDWIVVESNY